MFVSSPRILYPDISGANEVFHFSDGESRIHPEHTLVEAKFFVSTIIRALQMCRSDKDLSIASPYGHPPGGNTGQRFKTFRLVETASGARPLEA